VARREIYSTPRIGVVPLENIPLCISVNGVEVTGTILSLFPNDIEVAIASTGKHKGLHVPYFAMYEQNRFATTDRLGNTAGITERGRQRAEELLKELYDSP
jgi:hypothetical protein